MFFREEEGDGLGEREQGLQAIGRPFLPTTLLRNVRAPVYGIGRATGVSQYGHASGTGCAVLMSGMGVSDLLVSGTSGTDVGYGGLRSTSGATKGG
eukprot:3159056-Rhodomonas_salina.1